MKFRRDRDEEACGTQTPYLGMPCICMRTRGHAGAHECAADRAAELDGVCWRCRNPIGEPHEADCGSPKP